MQKTKPIHTELQTATLSYAGQPTDLNHFAFAEEHPSHVLHQLAPHVNILGYHDLPHPTMTHEQAEVFNGKGIVITERERGRGRAYRPIANIDLSSIVQDESINVGHILKAFREIVGYSFGGYGREDYDGLGVSINDQVGQIVFDCICRCKSDDHAARRYSRRKKHLIELSQAYLGIDDIAELDEVLFPGLSAKLKAEKVEQMRLFIAELRARQPVDDLVLFPQSE
ncbi:MAG: hypothetical protein ABIH34_05000 [Nanoarchaeota archaeon]